ncbi:uncharacterized protein LOC110728351 isoform X2 [Chenopodium quinoa]|nr:uncharacterized protein LOC110728351 isoform X2 [Chenopodium quinoa]
MNVLEVCSPEMEFTYVLLGWEGSTHDGRILRDAISRPNGLKVPKGCYYLCDGGCTNGEGFLAPYRGHLYHLKEWNRGVRQPLTAEEYFNLRFCIVLLEIADLEHFPGFIGAATSIGVRSHSYDHIPKPRTGWSHQIGD